MLSHDDTDTWQAASPATHTTEMEARAEEAAARERLAEQARGLAREAYCAEQAAPVDYYNWSAAGDEIGEFLDGEAA